MLYNLTVWYEILDSSKVKLQENEIMLHFFYRIFWTIIPQVKTLHLFWACLHVLLTPHELAVHFYSFLWCTNMRLLPPQVRGLLVHTLNQWPNCHSVTGEDERQHTMQEDLVSFWTRQQLKSSQPISFFFRTTQGELFGRVLQVSWTEKKMFQIWATRNSKFFIGHYSLHSLNFLTCKKKKRWIK